jgi:nucleoside-diphosphate-sugar epimerase
MTIKEMADVVAKMAGTRVIIDIPPKNVGYAPQSGFILNTDKLLSLGWTPRVTVMSSFYRRMLESWDRF